jgi:hypothetical protein
MLSRIAVLFLGVLGVLASGTSALALQAGGVEVGDLRPVPSWVSRSKSWKWTCSCMPLNWAR